MGWCKRTAAPRTTLCKSALFAGSSVLCIGGAAGALYGYVKLQDAAERSRKVAIGCNLACISLGTVGTGVYGYGAYDTFRHDLKSAKNICQFMSRSALAATFGLGSIIPLSITVLASLALKDNIANLNKNSSHAYRPPPA